MFIVALFVWVAATLPTPVGEAARPELPPLIEAADCATRSEARHDALDAPADSGEASPGQVVRVEVPALSLVRVDEFGRVVAVLTNTGCAPRRDDDTHLVVPSGEFVASHGDRFLLTRFSGDFSEPGRWVAQLPAAGDR